MKTTIISRAALLARHKASANVSAMRRLAKRRHVTARAALADDTGATTAEYALITLGACMFAAVLVTILRSEGIKSALTGLITDALQLVA